MVANPATVHAGLLFHLPSLSRASAATTVLRQSHRQGVHWCGPVPCPLRASQGSSAPQGVLAPPAWPPAALVSVVGTPGKCPSFCTPSLKRLVSP